MYFGRLVWYLFVCVITPLMVKGKVRAFRLSLLLLLRFEFGQRKGGGGYGTDRQGSGIQLGGHGLGGV